MKKNNWGKRIAGIAAALALIIGGTVGIGAYQNNSVASIVSLDVNPSVEIKVNKNEKVLEVTARNEEGREIVGDMDFKGSSLDVTVNALVGSMLRNGYLNDIRNSILVSVDNDNGKAAQALQQKLAVEIDAMLKGSTFEGAVLSQTVTADKELTQLAEQYGITEGKAQLIRLVLEKNPIHTFEQLAGLSINELNLLLESGPAAPAQDNITTTGTPSDKAYIGREKALEAALAHAGCVQSAVWGTEVDLDYENGRMVYEIEFETDGYEYDYEIDAGTGELLRFDVEPQGNKPQPPTPTQEPQVTPRPSDKPQPPATLLTGDEAKEAVLTHAGVAADSIRDYEIDLDYENGRKVYEIEFKADGWEYDYEIDAETGELILTGKERDDDRFDDDDDRYDDDDWDDRFDDDDDDDDDWDD